MPELAEVESYRKRWDCGVGEKVKRVVVNGGKRVFRGVEVERFVGLLAGAKFLGSEAAAKQMVFRFSGGIWMGLHLGMTGELRVEAGDFLPEKHDHLVIYQAKRALIFRDARMFGRVQFFEGAGEPEWWSGLAPAVSSEGFTLAVVGEFCRAHRKLAVKAGLLKQERFPGVGNWMADEILWRAGIHPGRLCGDLSEGEVEAVWREARAVCVGALASVGAGDEDPPADWFFHQRWTNGGHCPRHGVGLETGTMGGRTTRWCGLCQR